MTARIWRHFAGVAILIACLPGLSGAQVDETEVVFGVGAIISPDYKDVLDAAYSEYSITGGYGWFDLQLGVSAIQREKLSVTPSLHFLVNFVTGDESFANVVFVPTISGRYMPEPVPSFYVRGEVNYAIPNMGGDRIEADSGGIGLGGMVGYEFDSGMGFEVGYLYLPVEVDLFGDQNFGGVLFRFQGSF